MHRHRKHRTGLVVVIACAATWLAACGGSTSSDPGAGSGGTGGSGGSGGAGASAAGCPAVFPEHETSCKLTSGTSCWFPQGQCCPSWEAICVNGLWQSYPSGCGAPAPPPCPAEPPAEGSSCATEPCAGAYGTCTYGTCPGGSPETIATCNGSSWTLDLYDCPPLACESLSPCECFKTSGCQAVTDTCICPCDYNCPGEPPCQCDCGGGAYLGCKPSGG